MITLDTIRLYLFLVVIYLSLLFGIFWLILYLRKRRFVTVSKSSAEPITIIIPAHNEEENIKRCVNSILDQDYESDINIIIVDDGSTDNTYQIAKEIAKSNKRIKVLRQKNEGKSAAINKGLQHVKTKIFGFIDADSYMSKNVLKESVGHMGDYDSVVAPIIPMNTSNILLRWQEIEYMLTAITRRLSSLIGAMFLTPGFAIYRTNVVRKLGGFSRTTITEDLEMGLRLIVNGYKIGYISNAFVYTECPDTWRKFFRQRIRWTRGFIENMIKYRKMIMNKKYGHLGIFVLPMRVLVPLLTIILYALSTYDTILDFIRSIIDLINTNFDFMFFIQSQHLNVSTYATIFFLLLTSATLALVHIAKGYVRRKISFKDLLTFILIYPTINTLIIIVSLIYEIIGVKKIW